MDFSLLTSSRFGSSVAHPNDKYPLVFTSFFSFFFSLPVFPRLAMTARVGMYKRREEFASRRCVAPSVRPSARVVLVAMHQTFRESFASQAALEAIANDAIAMVGPG